MPDQNFKKTLEQLTADLANDKGGIFSFWRRWRIQRKIKNIQLSIEQSISLGIFESIVETREHNQQQRLKQQNLADMQLETQKLEESYRQEQLRCDKDDLQLRGVQRENAKGELEHKKLEREDAKAELEFKKEEREIRRIIMLRAAEFGLRPEDLAELMKASASSSGESDINKLLEKVKAGVIAKDYRHLMGANILRGELSGLYLERFIIEHSNKDPDIIEQELKDIDGQIEALKERKAQDERIGLVQGGKPRRKLRGTNKAADPDLRTGGEGDTE